MPNVKVKIMTTFTDPTGHRYQGGTEAEMGMAQAKDLQSAGYLRILALISEPQVKIIDPPKARRKARSVKVKR